MLLLFELTRDYFIIIPTLAAVGISYWTASLPIAAGISARVRAAATAETGAGSLASVDSDDIVLGPPLLPLIKILGLSPGEKKGGSTEQPRWVLGLSSCSQPSAVCGCGGASPEANDSGCLPCFPPDLVHTAEFVRHRESHS